MSSIQKLPCKPRIKQILKTHVFEYPLFLSELIELIHGDFSDGTVKIACNQLYEEGYFDAIIGLDENNHEFVFAITGLL